MIKILQNFLKCPPTKLALVVRGDLKMSKGKTAAQCAHAAVLCVQEAKHSKSDQTQKYLEYWLFAGQPKIVLKVNGGYKDLVELRNKCEELNITSALVQDAGRTQLSAGTITVLGIGPDTVDNIDKLVGHLKLL